MGLFERIEDDFRRAMKGHEVGRVSVLRVLRAAIQNAAIAARTSAKAALDDAAVEEVVRQEVKRCKDALVDFSRAARQDLVDATEREIAVLSAYLPPALTPTALRTLVRDVVARLRAAGVSEFGSIMRAVQREVSGRADGKAIADEVRQALRE